MVKPDPMFFELGVTPINAIVFLMRPETPEVEQQRLLSAFRTLGKLVAVRGRPDGCVELAVMFENPNELVAFLVGVAVATLREHTVTDLSRFEYEVSWSPHEPGGLW